MKYTMTEPCDSCPFLTKMKRGFSIGRLREFSFGAFPCHKTCDSSEDSGDFIANKTSVACAGALIFLEKRGAPSQMMRIAERLGFYDRRKLNMKSDVR